METVDLAIVGAGWNGLVAAKTYLEVNPSRNVVVLEAAASIGGVWARERLYTELKANNMIGTYEYSDFPMNEKRFGVKRGHHIPGQIVHDYLSAYTEEFKLKDKIRLGTKVTSAEYTPDKRWIISVASQDDSPITTKTFKADKLIMATGVTSQPFLPNFEGQDIFEAPLFHFKDLAANEKTIRAKGKPVTVFGGTKSAWDAVYSFASSGISVDWVIRESGHGPVWMGPAYVTPLKKALEKIPMIRFASLFSPCIWGDADGFTKIRNFLHGTWLGRKLVDLFWTALKMDTMNINKYDEHIETKKLKPWISPFWVATSFSILNYPTDFFQYVRNGTVKIHISDISHLSPNTIHLGDGVKITSSALVSCTGWKPTSGVKFLPDGIDRELGFPWAKDIIDKDMIDNVNDEIFRRFPRLKNQPTLNENYKPISKQTEPSILHPFRLVRFMVPPAMLKDRSIAFLGIPMTFTTPLLAEAQALWVTAYLGGKFSVSPRDRLSAPSIVSAANKVTDKLEYDILAETALHTQFGALRYPGGFGRRNPDFAFDAVPYLDMLLKDLGLRWRRKQTIWAHLFEPHGLEDYRGLIEEWKSTQQEAK